MGFWKVKFAVTDPKRDRRVGFRSLRFPIPSLDDTAAIARLRDSSKLELALGLMSLPPDVPPYGPYSDANFLAIVEYQSNGPYFIGEGDIDGVCGACGHLLVESLDEEQTKDLILRCPKCEAANVGTIGPVIAALTAILENQPEGEVLEQLSEAIDSALQAEDLAQAFADALASGDLADIIHGKAPSAEPLFHGFLVLRALALTSLLAKSRGRRYSDKEPGRDAAISLIGEPWESEERDRNELT